MWRTNKTSFEDKSQTWKTIETWCVRPVKEKSILSNYTAKYGRKAKGLVHIENISQRKFLSIEDNMVTMVQDRELGIWEKGEETIEGYYTLRDPLSERFLTAKSDNQLTLEGIV